MPDFTARIRLGVTVTPWVDPATASAPSRLNAHPAHQHSYLKVAAPGAIEIAATVGLVEAPLDAALVGRLFAWRWAEWSGTSPPTIVLAAAQSSVATVSLTLGHLGHFLLWIERPLGGAVAIPFHVEPA